MSSILEALKKLEEEKTSKQSGSGHISGKIVKPGRKAKQRPAWVFPVALAVVAFTAILGTYLFMAGSSSQTGTPQNQAMVPDKKIESLQRQTTGSNSPPPLAAKQPSATKEKPPSKANPLPHRVKPDEMANEAAGPPQRAAAPATTSPPPAGQENKPALPELRVSGIGWQKGSADRLAVVNGRPVAEGATIDGAKVEEIFPDRVRFSIGDRSIDVSLDMPDGENR